MALLMQRRLLLICAALTLAAAVALTFPAAATVTADVTGVPAAPGAGGAVHPVATAPPAARRTAAIRFHLAREGCSLQVGAHAYINEAGRVAGQWRLEKGRHWRSQCTPNQVSDAQQQKAEQQQLLESGCQRHHQTVSERRWLGPM